MIGLKDFFGKIKGELLADRPLILAMIVEKRGSAPRGIGAHMLILQNGDTVDTIGGGILEYLAVEQAKINLLEKKSEIKDFSLNNKTAAKIGMVCGLYQTSFYTPSCVKCFSGQGKLSMQCHASGVLFIRFQILDFFLLCK